MRRSPAAAPRRRCRRGRSSGSRGVRAAAAAPRPARVGHVLAQHVARVEAVVVDEQEAVLGVREQDPRLADAGAARHRLRPRDHGLAHPQVAGILDSNAAVSHAEIVRSESWSASTSSWSAPGPAGSLTAHLLAREGVRTLLVDRARFPRDKPCGGGVTLRGARLLPFAIGPVVERQITTIAFRHPDARRVRARRSRAGRADDAAQAPRRLPGRAGGARRRRLPRRRARAHRRARRADGRPGRDLRRRLAARAPRCWSRPTARTASAGARCTSARTASSPRRSRPTSPTTPSARASSRTSRCSRWATSRAATAGSSPRATTRTSASAAGTRRGRTCATTCARVCDRHGIAWSALTEMRGHRLPMRGAGTQVAHGRALAVGDAAGLVDPLSGDGMYEAFTSAHVASACVARRPRRPREPTSRPIPPGSTPRSAATPRWPGSPRRRSSARPASRCASRARARSAGGSCMRTATSRDPLTRTAPNPVWRRAERVARRLLGPEADAT